MQGLGFKDIYKVRTKIRGLKLKLTDSQTRNFEAFAATFKNEGFSKLFLDQHNHFADKTPFKRRTPLEENDSDKDDRKLGAAGTLSVCGRQIDAVKLHGYPFLTTKSLWKKGKGKQCRQNLTSLGLIGFKSTLRKGLVWRVDCRLAVDELKAYLRSAGERVGGRKTDLIQRIKDHIRIRIDNG